MLCLYSVMAFTSFTEVGQKLNSNSSHQNHWGGGGIFTAPDAWPCPEGFLVYLSGRAQNQECFQSFSGDFNV